VRSIHLYPGDSALSRAPSVPDGRFAPSNDVGSYAGKANQARQIPTEEPDEMCPTVIGQEELSKAATPTLLGLGDNHPHTRKKRSIQKPKEYNPEIHHHTM